MSMYALVSGGGSPGVTTTALALALTWPRPVVVAECDPACGDIVAGLFAGHLASPHGLIGLAFAASRGQAALAAELEAQLVPLADSRNAMFLAGLGDPRQAIGLADAWPPIALTLASHKAAVIADCGRIDAGGCLPLSVMAESAAVVMVLRPSLRQVARASARIEMIAQQLDGQARIGLLLIGDHGIAPKEIRKTLGLQVIATLPLDFRTAAVLSDGEGRRSGLAGRPLIRGARAAGTAIVQFALGITPRDQGTVPTGEAR
jgi:hypothetical protein